MNDTLYHAVSTPLVIVEEMNEADQRLAWENYLKRQSLLNRLFCARTVESVEAIMETLLDEGHNPDEWIDNALDNLVICDA